MAEDDAGVDDRHWDVALAAECLNAVDGIEWHPAQDEKEHNDREILRGLHLFAAGLRQDVDAGRVAVAVVEA